MEFFYIIMRERTIMMKLDHAHEVDDMDETWQRGWTWFVMDWTMWIRFTASTKWDNMYGNDELHNINNEHEWNLFICMKFITPMN
jgi:hypothetical protein